MKRGSSIGIFLLVCLFAYFSNGKDTQVNTYAQSQSQEKLIDAYNNQKSDVMVQIRAKVIKLLRDDNQGSRHQRFIIKLKTGQTILVAHNIDLAKKITSLKKGDTIEIKGEYEWNAKGGVIHWTHHDPKGYHEGGWIKHNQKTYK
ncbi:MAG: DUF3465 domain-containing protein [Campylobacterota bacterium]|nr:DUF3465 domain-containing protein [Campylobacterota bacterium]